jgi:hypothetical protein
MKHSVSIMGRRFLFVAAAIGVTTLAYADDTPGFPSAPMDPKVHEVLSKVVAFYTARTNFEVDLTSTVIDARPGMKTQMNNTYHLKVARPNSYALTDRDSLFSNDTVISDGKTVVNYYPSTQEYHSRNLPEKRSNDPMDRMADNAELLLMESGPPLGFEALMQQDPLEAFSENLATSRDMGSDRVGKIPAHHVRLSSIPYTLDLWIAEGKQPILLRTAIKFDPSSVFKDLPGDGSVNLEKIALGFDKMSRTTLYTNWKFDQPFPPDTFTFRPSPGVKLMRDTDSPAKDHSTKDDNLVPVDAKSATGH